MMTGPEHWRHAEDDMRTADALFSESDGEGGRFALARAQVHATLALAAATANPLASMWQDVAA